MRKRFTVIARKRLQFDASDPLVVELVQPCAELTPMASLNALGKAFFMVGWFVGQFEDRHREPVRNLNAYLLCRLGDSGLPQAFVTRAEAVGCHFVAETVERWRVLGDLMGADDAVLRAASRWFDETGIDLGSGVPKWIYGIVGELARVFEEEIADIRRIEVGRIEIERSDFSQSPVESESQIAETHEAFVSDELPESAASQVTSAPPVAPGPQVEETTNESGRKVESLSGPVAAAQTDLNDAGTEQESSAPAVVAEQNQVAEEAVPQPTEVNGRDVLFERYIRPRVDRIRRSPGASRPLRSELPAPFGFLALYAEGVLRAAARRGFMEGDRRWSLTELRDWESIGNFLFRRMQAAASIPWNRLHQWWGSVGEFTIDAYEAVGLAMLSHCAVVGRERGDPGEIWRSVRESLGSSARQSWFLSDDNLRQEVREVIRHVCLRFGLRHSFDDDERDRPQWLRTIQLQYGLSINWEYLSEYHKPAIASDLMDVESKNYSPEFSELWIHLLKHQKRLLSEFEVRQALHDNPWLPPDGVDGLLTRAGNRPASAHAYSEQFTSVFDEPEVHWPGTDPIVRLRVSRPLANRLAGDHYVLRVGRKQMQLRRTDGAFEIGFGGKWQSWCELDLKESWLPVAIEQDAEIVLTDHISLAPENGLFTVFSAQSGKAQDIDKPLILRGGLILLYRSELTVKPENQAADWRLAFGNEWKVALSPGPASADFGIFLDDEKLWPEISTPTRTYSLLQVTAVCEGGYWGEFSSVRLRGVSKDFEPLRFAFGRMEFPVVGDGAGRWTVRRFPLDPGLLHGVENPRARLRGWSGERAQTVECLWSSPAIRGALISTHGAWRPLHLVTDRTFLKDAQISLVYHESEGRLLAGSQICGLLENGRSAIDSGRVAGWGEELSLIHGLGAPEHRVRVAERIHDCGILKRVDEMNEWTILTLTREIEPGPKHSVWTWPVGGAEPRPVQICRAELNKWFMGESDDTRGAVAWAVAHDGVRLGSRWVDSPAEVIAEIAREGSNWSDIATWLRWFKAPMLSETVVPVIRGRVTQQPIETLIAWSASQAGEVKFDDADRDADHLIRRFLWDWVPESEEAARALRCAQILPGDWVVALQNGGCVERVIHASPILLYSLVHWGMAQLYDDLDERHLATICCKLRNQSTFGDAAGRENRISDAAWSRAHGELLVEAGRDLGKVDTNFLASNSFVGTARSIPTKIPIRDADRERLLIAMSSSPYRRWIAGMLLDEFYRSLSTSL